MKLNLDSHAITLTCPVCQKEFSETVGRLKHNPTIPCPSCQTPISIKADQLASSLATAQKGLDNLGAALGKLK